ncbi:PREDICTED: probable RNA-binding protein 18 [Branchiostoma belcheri]|uniref:Probable RNA-binding protein 18 n=1 Tax=Branchiostoma belcheri TaxID=7741 RepID=A0A6P5AM98_BRABE|nr:PREDICTED: probable RNA-binding protein 18 [Branchiostoma belcheri]
MAFEFQAAKLAEKTTEPLPLENASLLSDAPDQDGNRLWIGNLDTRLTEFHLLKLVKKYGTVRQLDFLFHKSGPQEGQPRGYCFVSYQTREEAEKCIQAMNGKMALSKKLVVRWAHSPRPLSWQSSSKNTLQSTREDSKESNISKQVKIQAIEAKLRMMEEQKDDLPSSSSSSRAGPSQPRPQDRKRPRHQPYSRGNRGRRR